MAISGTAFCRLLLIPDGAFMITSLPSRSSIAALLTSIMLAWLAASAPPATAAESATATPATAPVALNPRHPERYVVKRGDTLWDIAAMFLRDPWYWPEIWYANPQVSNPHLIYPGDVLSLIYVNGRPQLQLERGGAVSGTEKLSPRIREEDLDEAIPSISLEAIGAFLDRGAVLQKDEINKAPYVLAVREGHMIGSAGNDVYVRGTVAGVGHGYNVVHIGSGLVDPDDGEVLGYEGIYAGAGNIRQIDDPSTLLLADSGREVLEGDRLIEQNQAYPAYFTPRAPAQDVDGSIIAVIDGVSQIGQYQVIVINRGSRHGLEPGSVLRVWQSGDMVSDRSKTGITSRKVRLPDEPAGISMVFRTYERVSYALIMEASSAIHVMDTVRNPD
jgi:LysM repeat protein